MGGSPYNRHPLGPLLVVWLASLLLVMLALFVLDAIEYAYRRIGIGEDALFALVLASLVGGLVNIPVARVRGRATVGVGEIVAFGVRYRIPVVRRPTTTVLAVSLGGAVIPAGLSVFLLIRDGVWWQAVLALAVVATLVHLIARPVEGLGIAVPALAPPLLAAATSLVVAPDTAAAVA